MEICRLENIKKNFQMGETITPVDDVNLSIHEGDFIVIEGPSGVGKSTFLYVLGTLLQPTEGKYYFDDVDVSTLNDQQKSDLRAKHIGFLFQDTNLIQALTLKQNIEFVLNHKNEELLENLLKHFGLDDRKEFLPHQLSGGQRRRAGAVRSMIHGPKLLLADEPTNDLDEHWAQVMIEAFKEQTQKGTAVVMVTHNKELAMHAKRRFVLHDGKLIEQN